MFRQREQVRLFDQGLQGRGHVRIARRLISRQNASVSSQIGNMLNNRSRRGHSILRRRLIPLSQVTPFRFFPLPGRLATSTESQRRGRPSWVAKDLTHPQRPSNRLRDPLWPSRESTG